MASTCKNLSLIATLGILLMLTVSSEAGPLDYNMMNCFDFARHMGGTVPNRFGLIGGNAAGGAAGAVGAAAGALGAKRQLSSMLPSSMSNLFSSVTNLGSQNIANCQSAERHTACTSIDDFLEANFPGWFFEYQVTNNFNHVVSQMAPQHPYHALFEASLKAYKCFCVC